jgi:hypothetical protein
VEATNGIADVPQPASADLRRPDLHEMLFEAELPWFTVRARLRQAGQVACKLCWYSLDHIAPDLERTVPRGLPPTTREMWSRMKS